MRPPAPHRPGHSRAATGRARGGFTGNVTVSCAAGSSLGSWKVGWTFGAGRQVTQTWNAGCTRSGAAVSCSNASYNGSVPSGGSVSFGFNGTWSGSNAVPAVTLS